MTPKQCLHIQIPRPKQCAPVDYGLFVESFSYAWRVANEVKESPLPEQPDEVDQHLLQNGLQPTPALRAPLVGIKRLSERCQEYPQYEALLVRCGALLDLLPDLPADLTPARARACGPHPAVYETAAEIYLSADFTFTSGAFVQEARSRLPKYPCVDQMLNCKLLGALQARFPDALRQDVHLVMLLLSSETSSLLVYHYGRKTAKLGLKDIPQYPIPGYYSITATLFLALRWLMEAPLETLVRLDPEGHLFKLQA